MQNLPAVNMSNLPADIQAKLKADAEAMQKKIGAPGGDKIRLLREKKFKLPDGRESAGPLRVVIVDFVSLNAFYDRPFNEKDKTPAACYALGAVKPKDLVPSLKSPVKQADKCTGCPNNEFGSKGAGKACGNHYLLGCVEPTADPDGPVYIIQLGPKTTRNWEGYVSSIMMKHGAPPILVSTEIWFDPDEASQVLRFGNPESNENLALHMARKDAILKRLLVEPDVSSYAPLAKPGGKKGK